MTNITEQHKESFAALRDPEYCNFALFSCFFDGEPTACIVAVNQDGAEYNIAPMFVAVTPAMLAKLTDHEGVKP